MTRLGVVGSGTMGAQIAQQAALNGIETALTDVAEEQLRKAVESNRALLARRVERGRLDAAAAHQALALVRTTVDLEEAVVDADLVIEAIVEQLEPKQELFERLDRLSRPDTILATNSSTMPVSAVSARVRQKDRCCNIHFFHPVLVMELAEVVKGPDTSEETVERAMAYVREMGRVPVLIRKEIDGFIVNRILHAASQEAYNLLDQGVASFEDIDLAVEKGLNWPMGPFRLGDFSGLDVTYNARMHRYRATGDPRHRPSPQLEAKVKAGHLGRKTGRGWYVYDEGKA
jgi:3-hydroxybutyryl-CoA dehydrogenase